MKEAIFILLVILILLALTAVKYRKQIAGMIGFARMLKDVRAGMTQQFPRVQPRTETSIPLVNCSRCDIWIPENKAIKVSGNYICSEH